MSAAPTVVPGPTLALDVGRTRCRISDADRASTVTIASGIGLADHDGPARLVDLVELAVRAWTADTDRPAAEAATVAPRALGVATTGGLGPSTADELRDRLAAIWPGTDLLVTGDVVAAHAGALGGRPGVVAVAGTGAVALGIGADAATVIVDGHGPWLGDEGSGHAIGRAGLQAALRHHDGRPGGSAALAVAARDVFGPLDGLAASVHASPTVARDIAAFAPAVAAAARDGDPAAIAAWDAAVDALAVTIDTAVTAVSATALALRGSLFDLDDLLAGPVRQAVTATRPDLQVVSSSGDALDGVLALLAGTHTLHESLVRRALPTTSGNATTAPTSRADTTAGPSASEHHRRPDRTSPAASGPRAGPTTSSLPVGPGAPTPPNDDEHHPPRARPSANARGETR